MNDDWATIRAGRVLEKLSDGAAMSERVEEHFDEPDEMEDCPNCGGTGYSHHECGEDCCVCLDPEDNVVCNWCGGRG